MCHGWLYSNGLCLNYVFLKKKIKILIELSLNGISSRLFPVCFIWFVSSLLSSFFIHFLLPLLVYFLMSNESDLN